MSVNSDLIKEWFLKSLTARAAYAYFSGIPATNVPIRQSAGELEMEISGESGVMAALQSLATGQQAKFSEELAMYFAAHFATIDHQPNTASGYSATLFAVRSQPIEIVDGHLPTTSPDGAQQVYTEYVFAQRGTEPTGDQIMEDGIKADGGAGLVGSPNAQRQDMNAYWARLVGNAFESPLGDIPTVLSDLRGGVTVTGHSLGGALSAWFVLDHESDAGAVTGLTFNGVGIASWAQGAPTAIMAWLRELLGASPSFPSIQMQNLIGEEGRELGAGLNTMLGPIQLVTIEDTPGDALNTGWHAMSNLTDSLAVYYLLSQLDGDIKPDSLRSILRSFTANKPDVRESFARWLQGVFQTSGPIGTEGQTAIFERINWLESLQRAGTAPTFSVVALSTMTADQLFELANVVGESGAAVRYALINAAPLVITGGSLDWSGRNSGALARENFTEEYLRERSTFLEHLNAAYSTDVVETNGTNISNLGSSYYAAEINGTAVTRSVASTISAALLGSGYGDIQLHLFGGEGSDTLQGGARDDLLFGAGGVDVLNGGGGNDTLDGGRGNDFLDGGAGVNTLIGGADFDTYSVALGSGTTRIRDSDGVGVIMIETEDGSHSLGEELRGMVGSANMAVDPELNTYRLSGNLSPNGSGDLTITTHDGRVIIIENYFSAPPSGGFNAPSLLASLRGGTGMEESTNDGPGGSSGMLGITMPPEEEAPPFPTTADHQFAPTIWEGGDGWFPWGGGVSYGFMNDFTSQTVNDHSELLDLRFFDAFHASPQPHLYVHGSFGDSYIRGITYRSNLIIDDFGYVEVPLGMEAVVIGESVGNDIIEGGLFSDYILTHGGDDQVYAGGGTDILIDRPEAWTEFGTVDWVNAPGHSNRDQLFGEAGNDFISANAGDGYLSGGDGGDVLLGGAGADTMLGGAGNDMLSGDTKNTSYLLDYTVNDVQLNVQNLSGEIEHYGADVLDGGDGEDLLIGGGGADTLFGGEGNDILMGDLVILNAQGTWTWEAPPAGNSATYTFASILAEHEFDPDSIHGADVLYGEGGNDFLFGGGLGDELHGGDGSDVIYGENQGNGTANEAAIALAYHGADRLFGDAGNDFLYGNGGDDFVDGGDGDDVLVGDSTSNAAEIGNDEIHGGAGVDLIVGNGGDDRIYGDAGNDDLNGDAGNDYVNGGDGNDNIHGGLGNDTLEGGAGVDAIGGDDGDDTLVASAGGDSLYGGAGDDTFVLRVGSGATYINDTSGSTNVKFEGAVRRGDIRVEAGTFNGGQSIRVYFSATDYAFVEAADFDRIDRFDFSDGTSLSASELLLAYQPAAGNLGDGRVHLNVDSGLVGLHAAGPDLLLHYAGQNPNWVDTADLTNKGVLWIKGAGVDYGMGTGDVLVIKNWYTTGPTSSISAIVGQFGEVVDLGLAAWNLARTEQSTAATPYAVGNGGDDALTGTVADDTLLGGAGNDTLDGGGGSDIVGGQSGNDTFVIRPAGGFDILADDAGLDVIQFADGIRSTDVTFREVARGLEILIGDPAAGNRAIVLDWFDGSANKIEQFVFSGDAVTWSAADVESRITGNRRPVAGALSDQDVAANQAFNFSIPVGTFTDPNGDSLTLIAQQSSGGALPDWITFDAVTKTFSGVQPATGPSEINITVTAVDPGSLYSSSTFVLNRVTYINGTSAGETLTGSEGRDIVFADGGDDYVYGMGGNDSLNGGAGVDTLYGGDGADVLDGGAGIDHYDGGLGNDTYIFTRPSTPGSREENYVATNAASEIDTILLGSQIALTDVRVDHNLHLLISDPLDPDGVSTEIAIPTGFPGVGAFEVRFVDQPGVVWTESTLRAMSFVGGGLDDGIVGTDNADVLSGNGGSDSLYGGLGNDDLRGGSGKDSLYGEAGDDVYRFGRGDLLDRIDDMEGQNRIALDAGIAPNQVTLYRTSDVPSNYGDDLVIVIDNGQDQLHIAGFFDAAYTNCLSQIEFANGTVWNTATILANVIDVGGVMNDQTGTSANNTFTVDHWGDFVQGLGGVDTINSSVSFMLGSDVENLTLTGVLDIDALGNSGSNVLTGNAGANLLNGRGGSDTLIGGAGDDTYYVEGTGTFDPPDELVTELLNGGYDTIIARSRDATLPDNVERLVGESWGLPFGSGVELLVGNSLDNVIDARMRHNSSEYWSVRIDGGAGADLMIGSGEGMSNRYVVDNIGDVVRETRDDVGDDSGTDTIEAYVSYTLNDRIESIEMMSSTATTGTGNAYTNRLDGSTGSGAHTLIGLGGDDTYILGAGDVAVESAGGGTDTVTLTSASGFAGGVASLASFVNIENLVVADAFGVATLNGNAGANVLSGNASANTLIGGQGDDTLTGNGGSDVFGGFGTTTGNDVILVGTSATGDARTVEFSAAESLSISQLQFLRVGNDLLIQTAPGSSVRVQSFMAGAQPLNFKFSLYSGAVRYDYTAAQVAAVLNGTNGGPSVAVPIPDSPQAILGQAFSYQFGANTFTDIESQASLALTATLADGSALPSWLTFNAGARTFSGTPTGAGGPLTVRVRATDAGLAAAFDDFVIDVSAGPIVGTSGNDNLVGTSGNDVIQGLAGNDTLNGGAGTDQMFGGLGDDTYVVDNTGDTTIESPNEGTDVVQSSVTFTLSAEVENLSLTGGGNINGTGNTLDNVLMGNTGINTLAGGAGNDTLNGGTSGADILQGNAGNDTYVVDHTGVTVTEAASEGTDLVQSTVAFTLGNNVENLTLQLAGNVNGTGNGLDNVLMGNTGINTLAGGAGNDTLNGGTSGADILQGNAGNDTYVVDHTGVTVTEAASEGTDLVQSTVAFTLGANVENLTLTGTSAINGTGNTLNNTIIGNSANNTLNAGTGGTDTLQGGAGDDTYSVDHTGVTVTEAASEGTDLVQSTVAFTLGNNVENLTLQLAGNVNGTGNGLDNVLMGNTGINTLAGGAGNDTLNGGTSGADILQGNAGNDTYVVDHTGVTVTEAASEGTDLVQSTVAFTLGANVENLTLTLTGSVNGTGNGLDNVLMGNTGINTLAGGAGNDTLNGGTSGADILQGNAGNDTYVVDHTGVTVTEAASEGTDLVQSTVAFTLGANVENLTLTGTGAVAGTGNTLNNTIIGNSANNTLNAGTGGTDVLQGGAGDDTYSVDHTGVTVTEAANEGTDLVSSSVTFTLGSNVENLTLTLTGSVNGTGNGLDNVLMGNTGLNTLAGGAGNDTLNGGTSGADILQGNAGNDTYVIDHTGVTVTEAASEGTDLVQSTVAFTLGANVENLTLTGTGAVAGTGNTANNILIGNSGANTLDGSSGDDTLAGGGGADSLTGGLGTDIYQYTSGGGADTINNVAADSLIDRLQFTDLLSTQVAFSKSGNNLVMTRIGTPADTVTVTNWFSATANRLDFVNFTNREVTAAQIDTLVNGGGGSFPLGAPPMASMMLATDFMDTPAPTGDFASNVRRLPQMSTLAESMEAAEKIHAYSKIDGKNAPIRWQPIKDFLPTPSIDTAHDRLVSAMASFGSEHLAGLSALSSHEVIEGGVLAAAPAIEVHMLRNPILGRILATTPELMS